MKAATLFLAFGFVDQLAYFNDGFARHDHAGHARSAFGQRQFDAREAVTIGRHGP